MNTLTHSMLGGCAEQGWKLVSMKMKSVRSEGSPNRASAHRRLGSVIVLKSFWFARQAGRGGSVRTLARCQSRANNRAAAGSAHDLIGRCNRNRRKVGVGGVVHDNGREVVVRYSRE